MDISQSIIDANELLLEHMEFRYMRGMLTLEDQQTGLQSLAISGLTLEELQEIVRFATRQTLLMLYNQERALPNPRADILAFFEDELSHGR